MVLVFSKMYTYLPTHRVAYIKNAQFLSIIPISILKGQDSEEAEFTSAFLRENRLVQGFMSTHLGCKQQLESQSVWPVPVTSTLPRESPMAFQRRSSLQETRMSLWGCMRMLHREREERE